MAKVKKYDVNECEYAAVNKPPGQDSSYKSCLCTLLVFLVICAVVLIFSNVNWQKKDSDKSTTGDAEILGLYGNHTKEKDEHIIQSTTTRRTYTTRPQKEKEKTTHGSDKHTTSATATSKEVVSPDAEENKTEPPQREPTSSTTETTEIHITTQSKPDINISTTEKDVDIENGRTSVGSFATTEHVHASSTETSHTEKEMKSQTEDSISGQEKQSTEEDTAKRATTVNDKIETIQTTTENVDESSAEIVNSFSTKVTFSPTTSTIQPSVSTTQSYITEDQEMYNPSVTEGTTSIVPEEKSDETTTTDVGQSTTMKSTSTTQEAGESPAEIDGVFLTETTSPHTTEDEELRKPTLTEESTTTATERTPDGATTTDIVQSATMKRTSTTEEAGEPPGEIDSSLFTEITSSATTTITKDPVTSTQAHTTAVKASKFFQNVSNKTCNNGKCRAVASRLLNLMNHSIDPCDDFYQFACGGLQYNPPEDDEDVWRRLQNQVDAIGENDQQVHLIAFKSFYDSCIEHQEKIFYKSRVDNVFAILQDRVGEMLLKNYTGKVELTELIAEMILSGSFPLFEIKLDIKNGEYILRLRLPGQTLGIPREVERDWSALLETERKCLDGQRFKMERSTSIYLDSIYQEYNECKRNISMYLDNVQNAILEVGCFKNLEPYVRSQMMADLRTTLEWDVLDILNEFRRPPIQEQLRSLDEEEITVQKLQKEYNLLEWGKLFGILTKTKISTDTVVLLKGSSLLNLIFDKLKLCEKRRLYNALLSMYTADLYKNYVMPKNSDSNSRYCLNHAVDLMPDIASFLYAQTWFSLPADRAAVDARQKVVTDLVHNLADELSEELKAQEWYNDKDGDQMSNMLTSLSSVYYMGTDVAKLNAKYSFQNDGSEYLDSMLKLKHLTNTELYGLFGQKYSRRHLFTYFVRSFDRFPVSYYNTLEIAVPIVALMNYDDNLPSYISVTTLEFHLAKEIARHFDNTGMNLLPDLDSSTVSNYEAFVQGTNDLVSSELTNENNKKFTFKLVPKISEDERISDNTAMRMITSKILLKIEQDGLLPWVQFSYSNEKILFIALAQGYCKKMSDVDTMKHIYESTVLPPILQVDNLIFNSKHFEHIFQCPPGSKMVQYANFQFPIMEDMDIS